MKGIFLGRVIALLFCVHGIAANLRIRRNGQGLDYVPIDEIPATVTVLELKNNNLTQLSNHIFKNHSLINELDLSSNRIAELSEECFLGIVNLTKLILRANRLTILPDLSLLSDTLEHLNLQDNRIVAAAFSEILLNKLKFLNLEANKLHQLTTRDFRYRMPKIATFNLKNNDIATVESGFFWESTHLEILDLSLNGLMEFNPYESGISSSILQLYLEYNQIPGFQDGSLAGLIHLETLQLDYNNLTTFDIGRLTSEQGLPRLLNLHLAGNQIVTMPSNSFLSSNLTIFGIGENNKSYISSNYFTNISQVATLNLNSTSLTEMPHFNVTLASLKVFILSNNNIKSLNLSVEYASKIPEIVELDVSFNILSNITGHMDTTLNKLEILNLKNNMITWIRQDFFAMMPKLKVLNLKHNFLSGLQILNELSFIKTINLKDNMLTAFPLFGIEILQSVVSLCLSNNQIINPITMTSIYRTDNPDFNATSLKLLYLSGNLGAGSIPDEVWKTMPSLEKLSLSSTGLSSFPDVSPLKELTHLFLRSNNIDIINHFINLKNLTKLSLRQNRLITLPNLLELVNEVSSRLLEVDLRQNNFRCDASMCWIKLMSFR